MKALKVKAIRFQFVKRTEVSAYVNHNFRISDWKFTWEESEDVPSYATIDGKGLMLSGGFLGRNITTTVINPMQLLVALATGTACEVTCGDRNDTVHIKFGKRAIRNVIIYNKRNVGSDTTTELSSDDESNSSYENMDRNDGEYCEEYGYISEQQEETGNDGGNEEVMESEDNEEAEVTSNEEQTRYEEMEELRGVWQND